MTKLEEAKARGFKEAVVFVSATGVPDCVVFGKLKVKNFKPENPQNLTKDDEASLNMNGDIVSEGGFGVIYDASTNTWGQTLNLMVYTTSKTRTNTKVVKAFDDYLDE